VRAREGGGASRIQNSEIKLLKRRPAREFDRKIYKHINHSVNRDSYRVAVDNDTR